MSRTAAFYFTELPDAYATRTGRPENVGVIGVAVFREDAAARRFSRYKDKIAEARRATRRRARAPAARRNRAGSRSERDRCAARDRGRCGAAAQPCPSPRRVKLGTGHGRSEESQAQMVRFERESATPTETIAIHYDRRENLVAMGVLPVRRLARSPDPFPAWPRFAPDPPRR